MSSADWTTFNSKQNALTNPVTGTGTTNYLPKFTGTSTLGNSLIFDNGTQLGFGTATPNTAFNFVASYAGHLSSIQNNNAGYYSSLDIYDSTGAERIILGYGNASVTNALAGKAFLFTPSGVDMNFYTGGINQRMTILSTGNVGIGTSSPSARLDVRVPVESPATGAVALIAGTSNGSNDIFRWFDGTTQLGVIKNNGWVGIGTTNPSQILEVFGPRVKFGDTGGFELNFNATYAAFQIASTERMRITSGGDVGIGNANAVGHRLLVAGRDASSSYYALVVTNNSLSSLLYIRNDGYAWISQNAWAYGSDRRLKENINYIESGLDKILALKPAKFDYIDGIKNNIGWIAQDVEEVIPEAVLVNTNDEREYLSLKSDFIIPYLVKAVQELNQKIVALESK